MNNQKIKIATLNVKGLNDLSKRQKTFTLLKSYKFDIILLQETNLTNTKTRDFIKQQWSYNSIWTDKIAILAGNKYIKFTNSKAIQEGRILTAQCKIKQRMFNITNIYAPPRMQERLCFFNNWSPIIKHS